MANHAFLPGWQFRWTSLLLVTVSFATETQYFTGIDNMEKVPLGDGLLKMDNMGSHLKYQLLSKFPILGRKRRVNVPIKS